MQALDDAMPRALRRLLGDHWRDRLKKAVAQELAPPQREPKKRNLTDAQREARRQSILAVNARRWGKAPAQAAPEQPPPAPPPAPTPAPAPAITKVKATRDANRAAREAADATDPGLNAAEAHEARDMLAKGKGALELQEWFGGGLAWWQAWTARHRQAGRAA
jgi:hypothetical protein